MSEQMSLLKKAIRPIVIMLLIFLAASVTETIAGPDCTRIERKTNEVIVDGYTIKFFTFNCEETIQLYRDEIAALVKISDRDGEILEEEIGGWQYGEEWYPPSAIRLAEIPAGFPYLIFHSTNYSPANISNSYILYSTKPTLQKYGEINSPVNEYQVITHQGNEDIVSHRVKYKISCKIENG